MRKRISGYYVPLCREKTDPIRKRLSKQCLALQKKRFDYISSLTTKDWEDKLEKEIYDNVYLISDNIREDCEPTLINSKIKEQWFNLMRDVRESVEEYRNRILQEESNKLKLLRNDLLEEYYSMYLCNRQSTFFIHKGELYLDIWSSIGINGLGEVDYLFKKKDEKIRCFCSPICFPDLHSYEEVKQVLTDYIVNHPEAKGTIFYNQFIEVIEDRDSLVKNFWKVHPHGIIHFR